ncbi:MAG: hypothetical protein IT548_06635 [Alphaproteobacteria bacterium]|nr:hypothetical protein [Alphaproteobacteria bacterium]
MTDETVLDLASLKLDYEAQIVSIEALAWRYGISRRNLYALVNTHHWRQRRPRRVDRDSLVERLLRLIETQVLKLEFAMDDPETDESAVLVKLASTLDRLISLRAEAPPQRRKASKAMTALRDKVARRIAQLDES